MKRAGAILLLGLAAGANPCRAQALDSSSWMRRPEVREIRTIVEQVQRSIDRHQLVRVDTTVCAGERFETSYSIYRDRRGTIRRVETSYAGEDHGERTTYTYDSSGRVRFALSRQAAVNGSRAELRAYWAPDGHMLERRTKEIVGEGFPWNDPEPIKPLSEELSRDCDD